MSLHLYVIFFAVSFAASVAGAICGIGGGILIKPLLDAFGVLSVSSISFLSGCTVLSMSCYSVGKSKLNGYSRVDMKIGTPLAVGAAIGGALGKVIFRAVSAISSDPNKVGAIQAACLLVITFVILIYTVNKDKVHTLHVKNLLICILLGLFLGICSSFLGIGGGPINLAVLFYFFSMDTKEAAENSLYIILFSQSTSLINTLVTGTVPVFGIGVLVLMVGGGLLGGMVGRKINKTVEENTVNRLFIGLMIIIILINVYNIY